MLNYFLSEHGVMMMLKLVLRCLLVSFLFSLAACSAPTANASFQEGREYQVIPSASTDTTPRNKVTVIEFFSYGCPWCYRLEPALENWLAHKARDVEFERIPVTFEPGWDVLAKVFYTTKSLGLAEKFMTPTFAAVQDQGLDLTNVDTTEQYFVNHGVSKQDFESTYNFSLGIDAQVQRGDKIIKQYGIIAVPAFVIDGKYLTNMGMAGGDNKRLLQIVNYLIAKEKPGDR